MRIVLQPCKTREKRFVPAKEAPEVLDWDALSERFLGHIPKADVEQRRSGARALRMLRVGSFIGLVTAKDDPDGTHYFVFYTPVRGGAIDSAVQQDELFVERIRSVFRVESVTVDASVQEFTDSAGEP